MRTDHVKRTKRLADALWPTARQAVLGLMLAEVDREWHLREVARRTALSPSTVHSEIGSLVAAGILARREEIGRVYYRADTACSIFAELRAIVLKTVGLVDVLRGALEGLSGLELAFVYGSLARGEETSQSDVDLLLVGAVSLRALSGRLRAVQESLARPVNPTAYPVEEFRARLAEGHYFLTRVVAEPKLFVIGDADVLGRLAPS
jgi:uncharacterized protein